MEGLEADLKAVGHDLVADVKSLVSEAKADAVEFEGSVASEIVKLKAKVEANSGIAALEARVKAAETTLEAVVAKIGVKL